MGLVDKGIKEELLEAITTLAQKESTEAEGDSEKESGSGDSLGVGEILGDNSLGEGLEDLIGE